MRSRTAIAAWSNAAGGLEAGIGAGRAFCGRIGDGSCRFGYYRFTGTIGSPNSAIDSIVGQETAMAKPGPKRTIPGTTLFDGEQARKGYALNKMCFSFNSAQNRAAFQLDEAAYCRQYGLDARQTQAIRERDVLGLLAAGGNVYYLAKFAGILGLDVQDLGALQTGLTKDEFKARLLAAGR
jgi:protocatechuate 4,5-dioxygenase alpha chain